MTDHIKIPDVAPLVRALGDGIRTIYEFPFPIFKDDDLKVSVGGVEIAGGYDITGAGNTNGGYVTFTIPPANGAVVTMERKIAFARVSDFLEGGDFSAASLNTELDYLVAGLQQVNRNQSGMLHYASGENPGVTALPMRSIRANRVLGFDGDGNPAAFPVSGTLAPADFTVSGAGAVTRAVQDKFGEYVSVKDFGAVGDALHDDTAAINAALLAHDAVFIPKGTYLITSGIMLAAGKRIHGAGAGSILKTLSAINCITVTGDNAGFERLSIEGGSVAICIAPSVRNIRVTDIDIRNAATGIIIDGGCDGKFTRLTISKSAVNAIHLTKMGSVTPSGNMFRDIVIADDGANATGHGVYVEQADGKNSFTGIACVMGSAAQAVLRVGANVKDTAFTDIASTAAGTVPHMRIDTGSTGTSIINMVKTGGGAAVLDYTGGAYTAFNTPFDTKTRLDKTRISDVQAALQRFEPKIIATSGVVDITTDKTVQLISASGGAVTARLPNANTGIGIVLTLKKTDSSGNIVTVTENGGAGPDGQSWPLAKTNDYVTVVSDGAYWKVIASNRSPGSARFYDGYGTYDIDMAVDVYLLSTTAGAMTARLPTASSVKAVGRQITIKKVDATANAITITEQGGLGPDKFNPYLNAQYQAITIISDGSNWHVVSRFP